MTLCITLTGIAIFRTVDAVRYAMSPEEATLYLIYAIPPRSKPRTAGLYFIDWNGTAANGQPTRTMMRVRRNVGCRVELVSTTADELDPSMSVVETRVFDWSGVLVDLIAVTKVLVPTNAFEAYNVVIELPGRIAGFRRDRRATDAWKPDRVSSMGALRFEWIYAPGQESAYSLRRQPFLELMRRCKGSVPALPEARGPSAALRATVE